MMLFLMLQPVMNARAHLLRLALLLAEIPSVLIRCGRTVVTGLIVKLAVLPFGYFYKQHVTTFLHLGHQTDRIGRNALTTTDKADVF